MLISSIYSSTLLEVYYMKYYVLNIVLGCYVKFDMCEAPYEFDGENSIERLVEYWNKAKNHWKAIHYPCLVEEFELIPIKNKESANV